MDDPAVVLLAATAIIVSILVATFLSGIWLGWWNQRRREVGAATISARPAQGGSPRLGRRLHDLRLLNPVAVLWRHTQKSGRL